MGWRVVFTRCAKRAISFADQRVRGNSEGFSENGKCSLTNGGGLPGLILMHTPRSHLANTKLIEDTSYLLDSEDLPLDLACDLCCLRRERKSNVQVSGWGDLIDPPP